MADLRGTALPRTAIVSAAGMLALLLALLVAINPLLGLGLFIGIVAAAGFARSATFAVCAFVAAVYGEFITRHVGPTLSPVKLGGAALVVVAAATLVTASRAPAGSWAAHWRQARRDVAWTKHPVIVAALVAYVALALASAAWATDLGQVRSLGIRLVSDALVFLAVGVFVREAGQMRAIGWTALCAGAASWLYGVATHSELAGRAIGTFADPNEFAAALVPSAALGYAVVVTERKVTARIVGVALIGMCMVGIVQSESRGGMLAVLVAVGLLALTASGTERVRLVGGTLVVACGFALAIALTPPGEGLRGRLASNDSSGRTDLWKVALHEFRDHPVTGVGLGNYPVVSLRYLRSDVEHTELFVGAPRAAHNTFLEVLAELGAVGFALFIVIVGGCVVAVARAVVRSRRARPGHSPADFAALTYARACLAATCGVLAAGVFLSGEYQELLWVSLALCLAVGRATRTSSSSSRSTVA